MLRCDPGGFHPGGSGGFYGKGSLRAGADGDLTIMDIDREWEFDVKASASKSRNSPFAGWRLRGRATATIANGVVAWAERN